MCDALGRHGSALETLSPVLGPPPDSFLLDSALPLSPHTPPVGQVAVLEAKVAEFQDLAEEVPRLYHLYVYQDLAEEVPRLYHLYVYVCIQLAELEELARRGRGQGVCPHCYTIECV